MELQPAVQNYDWGKTGTSSLVAKFAAVEDGLESIDPQGKYAELWMG
jgi:mannose-6-phosphate isomerase